MINPEQIKNLREQTGVSIIACKQALEEAEGDFKKAISNDLDIPKALSVMWKMVKSDYPQSAKHQSILIMDQVLGLGLSKMKVTIICSSDDCESLSSTLEQSDLFSKKNIGHITSPNDAKDLCKANLMLLKLTNSPVSLEVVLENKKPDAALVVYAKPNEIQGPQWALLDQHRNVSVTNLRGRLMTDLLNAMMTTSYEKR